jgi:hypothetical protein
MRDRCVTVGHCRTQAFGHQVLYVFRFVFLFPDLDRETKHCYWMITRSLAIGGRIILRLEFTGGVLFSEPNHTGKSIDIAKSISFVGSLRYSDEKHQKSRRSDT